MSGGPERCILPSRLASHNRRLSRIRFVTPAERHQGLDRKILARRHVVYKQARGKNPERWPGQTRNWEPIGTVLLNPDREQPAEKRAA